MEKPDRKQYIYLLTHSSTGQKRCGEWVNNNIGECQSMLVDILISRSYESEAIEGFSYDDIENYYRPFDPAENITKATCPDCEEEVTEIDAFTEQCQSCYRNNREAQEIYEWWTVSNYTAGKLRDYGEPIIDNDYGTWWGRTTTGQSIKLDYVIAQIVADLDLEYWNKEDSTRLELMEGEANK